MAVTPEFDAVLDAVRRAFVDGAGAPVATGVRLLGPAETRAVLGDHVAVAVADPALLADLVPGQEITRAVAVATDGRELTAQLDIDRIVQDATDAATKATGAGFGAFFYNLVDEFGESYTLYTLSGVPREAFASFPMPRNTAVFGPTFDGTGTVRSPDITEDPRFGKNAPYHGMPEGHLPVCSHLPVPVLSPTTAEVLGGFFFGHPEADRFTARHEYLAEGIAGYTAIATCFYAVHRPAEGTLTYANAGHLPAILVGPDGSLGQIGEALAQPLDVGSAFPQRTVAFPPGADLVLYADGLVESRTRDLTLGVEWLLAGIPQLLAADDLGTAWDKLVEELTGGRHDDDIAVIHVRRRGEDGT